MAALQDFYDRVARSIRRGSVYDTDIPQYVADAVGTLENLHNWRHMWQESFQQTLLATDSSISFLGKVKSVRYLRFVAGAGSALVGRVAYAKKSQPTDIVAGRTYTSLAGTRFWLKGASFNTVLQLDGAFAQDVLYDLGWYQYSALDDSLPWLQIDQGVLLNQTLVEMGLLIRDEKVIGRAEAILARKISALLESDLVHQYDSDDSEMVPFADDVEQDLFDTEGAV